MSKRTEPVLPTFKNATLARHAGPSCTYLCDSPKGKCSRLKFETDIPTQGRVPVVFVKPVQIAFPGTIGSRSDTPQPPGRPPGHHPPVLGLRGLRKPSRQCEGQPHRSRSRSPPRRDLCPSPLIRKRRPRARYWVFVASLRNDPCRNRWSRPIP